MQSVRDENESKECILLTTVLLNSHRWEGIAGMDFVVWCLYKRGKRDVTLLTSCSVTCGFWNSDYFFGGLMDVAALV